MNPQVAKWKIFALTRARYQNGYESKAKATTTNEVLSRAPFSSNKMLRHLNKPNISSSWRRIHINNGFCLLFVYPSPNILQISVHNCHGLLSLNFHFSLPIILHTYSCINNVCLLATSPHLKTNPTK